MEAMKPLKMSCRAQHRRERITKRHLKDLSDPLQIPDMLFSEKYRVSKDLFMYLLEELRVHITPSQRSDAVPFELKLLSSLSFLATGSYQKIVASECDISLSQSSVSRSHLTIVNALNTVMQKHIQFPCTEQQRNDVKVSFYRKFGVPGVIGCIDGTFVAIIRPKEHEDAYFCRKGYHAINVAIISDCDLRIIGINATFGGSAHDSDVWQKMFLSGYIQGLYEQGETGWLLGDSGYPQRPWLMTPILHAEKGTPEAHYTDMHTRTRFTVNRCIGLLKSRWRCLTHVHTLHYAPHVCAKIVNACAVLHNLCIAANIELQDHVVSLENNDDIVYPGANSDDQGERAALVLQLWQNRIV